MNGRKSKEYKEDEQQQCDGFHREDISIVNMLQMLRAVSLEIG